MLLYLLFMAIDLNAEATAQENNAILNYAVVTPDDATRFSGLDYDDLERPVPVTIPLYPRAIVLSHIREFYPRKNNMKGTRIVFDNGSATIVHEDFEQVKDMLTTRNGGSLN